MHQYHRDRRHVLSALTLAAFGGLWCASPATAQSGAGLQPLAQPSEPTKAAFLARARALRDEAVHEGDQAYGAGGESAVIRKRRRPRKSGLSRWATSGQQPVKRTDLLKTDLDEIKGSEMNVWVADIAPCAATGTENRQGYV
jgi:hypothetical protein